MKSSIPKITTTLQTPVFPQAVHQKRPEIKLADAEVKTPKREKIFSKSRDTREDRGARQMKTAHSSQTFPHTR